MHKLLSHSIVNIYMTSLFTIILVSFLLVVIKCPTKQLKRRIYLVQSILVGMTW